MEKDKKTNSATILAACLLIKAVAIYFYLKFNGLGLSPDEAQYWTWSQHLDWGYYSKPPGIAWQIGLGTAFFGNTLLGVRAISMILGFMIPLQIYFLAKKSGCSERSSFWSALLFACTPIGVMASIMAITDVGMIFFWNGALYTLAAAFAERRTPYYSLLGVWIAAAALFKWTAFLLWPLICVVMFFFPTLKSWRMVVGFLISLCAFFPMIFWNYHHDWATFKHVFYSIWGHQTLHHAEHSYGNFLGFIAAQVALLSPVIFILSLLSLKALVDFKKQGFLGFCALGIMIYWTGILSLALSKKVQGNWGDFTYPMLFMLVASYLDQPKKVWKGTFNRWALGSSLGLIFFALMIPLVQSKNLLSSWKISYKINPFKHNLGWNNLNRALEEIHYNPEREFLFSSKYQISSILNFYVLEQKKAYFFNLFSIRKNQFCFWPGMPDEQIGKDGIFVVV